MTDIVKKVREAFAAELTVQGDLWRILRKETLVDLIN